MNPSNSVRASFVIFAVWIVGFLPKVISASEGSVFWQVWGVIVALAAFRFFILFWQTLADAVQFRRLGWVVAHVMFGPFASVVYYATAKVPPLDIPMTTSSGQPIQLNQSRGKAQLTRYSEKGEKGRLEM